MQQGQDAKMSTIRTKFIVVSLPRTGTKSLLQMAKTMGLSIQHAPGPSFEGFLNRVDIVADTPCFRPSIISNILTESSEMKFIYIVKNALRWAESMDKIGLSHNYNRMWESNNTEPETMTEHQHTDFGALQEIFLGSYTREHGVEAFKEHQRIIHELIPRDRLLDYSFNDGWEPLAEFMGVDVPDAEVPHLNKDTMFDRITG